MSDLDSILSDEAAVVEAPIEAVAEPETIGQQRGEDGRFAQKQTGVEQTVPPTDKLPPEEFAGLKDERRKRQEAETRADALEREIQTLRKPAEPAVPAPSIFEDEQGAFQHYGNQAVSTAVQEAEMRSVVRTSEMLMRQNVQDFDEMKGVYLQLERDNPTLIAQVMADPHPWNKAYNIAKNHQRMQELGATNLADLEAKLREQLTAEMQANPPANAALPSSLAGAQSSRVVANTASQGPPSLNDILTGKG